MNASGIVTKLPHLGGIRFAGADAGGFLHAQLTSDVSSLALNRLQRTAWLSAKGRVIVFGLLHHDEAGYELLVPHALIQTAISRLRPFILRSKVAIEDVSAQQLRIGLAGAGAVAWVEAEAGHSLDPGTGADAMPGRISRLPGEEPRYLLSGLLDDASRAFDAAVAAGISATGLPTWNQLRIADGVPYVGPEISERYIPQMLNLDVLGAISFDKGCYPGQEIVARTRYLGRLKRRLFRARLSAPVRPALLSGAYIGTDKVGEVVDAETAEEKTEALLVANSELAGAEVEVELTPQGQSERVTAKLEALVPPG